MAPLGASPAMMATSASSASSASSLPSGGVAFKLQTKSALALVQERRIEFVRARNAPTRVAVHADETKAKKERDVVVAVGEVERLLQWRHAKKIGPGLANLGNTCYLNSVLQCLSYTPSFAQYLLQKDVLARFNASAGATATTSGPASGKHLAKHGANSSGMGFCGARVMARLLQSVHGGAARVLQPKELVMNIRHVSKNFRIGRQEDSHEFFRLLLDAMQRSCLRKAHIKQENHPAAATTFIHRMFGGKLKNSLKCAKCQFVSERWDDFLDLSLEINNGISSIKGAIKHFTATETLDDSNAWKCSSCHQPSRAEKGMTIDTCPNVLVVQLKRFDGMFGKIKKHIEFAPTLDLSIGMSKSSEDRKRGRSRYELHAVLVHAGFSTNCGHYYAFVKGSSGQWYEMNDETVRWVSLDTVLQQKAYMLFYSRVLPPSEQPPPKETPEPKPEHKPVAVEKTKPEPIGEPVKAESAVKANGVKKPELTMEGFLTSLKTDLDKHKAVENGGAKAVVPVVSRPKSVVTYMVSVPVKNRATLKRRLVPVFSGSVGRFARFQSSAWRAATSLQMTTTEITTTDASSSELTNGHTEAAKPESVKNGPADKPPVRVVEKVTFNPRELRGFGEKNSALFGKSVEQWVASEEAHGADGLLLEKHERVLQQLKAEDWKHRRAQRKSSWDEELDAGKIKKIKKRKEFVANEGSANAFQLALLQKKLKQ